MNRYTISHTESDTVAALTTAIATTAEAASLAGESAPIQPTQIRRLSSGWVGAEWVRYVADYQDAQSVGYATLGDLERDHEWTDEMGAEFTDIDLELAYDLGAVGVHGVTGQDVDEGVLSPGTRVRRFMVGTNTDGLVCTFEASTDGGSRWFPHRSYEVPRVRFA